MRVPVPSRQLTYAAAHLCTAAANSSAERRRSALAGVILTALAVARLLCNSRSEEDAPHGTVGVTVGSLLRSGKGEWGDSFVIWGLVWRGVEDDGLARVAACVRVCCWCGAVLMSLRSTHSHTHKATSMLS